MLQSKQLSFQYPNTKPIVFPDFQVSAGHTLLISGASGCGKTTLLHLLAGLKQASNGEIMIEKDKISDFPANKMDQFRGEHIGIVYQQSYFIESLSVLDNLLLSPYANCKGRAKMIAKRLQIEHLLHRRPKQLSMGQQQRASIARAVMNQPKLILADEPTSALDNKNCSYVINLLFEEAIANNAALIVVSHDDRLRSEISDCIDLKSLNTN